MMAETTDHPTIGELHKAGVITDVQFSAALSAYLADPSPGVREIVEGIALDIAAAVAAEPWAARIAADEGAAELSKRMAIGAAIMRTRPIRPPQAGEESEG